MGMLKEFKEFAMRGNVVDMAVGVIIGAAFGKITTSVVNDVMMPPIGVLLGGVDFSDRAVEIVAATPEKAAVMLRYGAFINTVIDFLIVAFAVFLVVKLMNTLKKTEPPPPAEPTKQELLLTEIRDALLRR
ncbi:MAG TPA: large-conductance mechanosensitive channel protein MscL [Myxococcota bacterium]|nr:large-conductance mechanosensitive channel protein MscL [Myxococcota bacterium]